jgi:hypothetical protein
VTYILTIDASTQKAMAEAAAPYLSASSDCREFQRILTAMLSRRWPSLDVQVVHIHTDHIPLRHRFGIIVDGILDQGLIFSEVEAADHNTKGD